MRKRTRRIIEGLVVVVVGGLIVVAIGGWLFGDRTVTTTTSTTSTARPTTTSDQDGVPPSVRISTFIVVTNDPQAGRCTSRLAELERLGADLRAVVADQSDISSVTDRSRVIFTVRSGSGVSEDIEEVVGGIEAAAEANLEGISEGLSSRALISEISQVIPSVENQPNNAAIVIALGPNVDCG